MVCSDALIASPYLAAQYKLSSCETLLSQERLEPGRPSAEKRIGFLGVAAVSGSVDMVV
jgi:hypothetical protein